MEDLVGGPMLRPPGIAPGGRAGNKEQSERGTASPGLGLDPSISLPAASTLRGK